MHAPEYSIVCAVFYVNVTHQKPPSMHPPARYYNLYPEKQRLPGMKERGVPVHGAGLQGHFDAGGTGWGRPPTPHSVQRQVRRLGELGLTVNISEMDVRVAGVSASSVHRDRYQDGWMDRWMDRCMHG